MSFVQLKNIAFETRKFLIRDTIIITCLLAMVSGKKLRKVEQNDAVKQREYGSDVASILSRRIHIELSDTDSDSEGSDSSDGEWAD